MLRWTLEMITFSDIWPWSLPLTALSLLSNRCIWSGTPSVLSSIIYSFLCTVGTSAGQYYRGCSPVIHSGKVDKCDVTLLKDESRTVERCLCNRHLCNRVTSLRCYWQHLAAGVVAMALLTMYITWTKHKISGRGTEGPEIVPLNSRYNSTPYFTRKIRFSGA